jgi:hypothetical protein
MRQIELNSIQVVLNRYELQKSVGKSEGISTKRSCALNRNNKVKTDKIVQVEKTSSKSAQIGSKDYYPTNGKRSKMLIIDDSHARGYAANISSYLGKDPEIVGKVMPGVRLENNKIEHQRNKNSR